MLFDDCPISIALLDFKNIEYNLLFNINNMESLSQLNWAIIKAKATGCSCLTTIFDKDPNILRFSSIPPKE